MLIHVPPLRIVLLVSPSRMNPSTSSSTAHTLQTSRPQQGITCGFEKGNWHTWQRSAAGHWIGGSSGGGAVRPSDGIGGGFPDATEDNDKEFVVFGII